MSIVDNFINEYIKISRINSSNKPDDILKELSNFLEYTRIKDKNKMLDFKNNIKDSINKPLSICIKGEDDTGKTSFINAILQNNVIPKKTKLNLVIKYSNIPYIKIHMKENTTTHHINMLEIVDECDFIEVFLNDEILKDMTIIECEKDKFSDYDICICVNNKLEFQDCDFAILNKTDLLTKEELAAIKEKSKEKYTPIEINDIESLGKIPIIFTSIISQNNNIKEIMDKIITKKAKAKKATKIKTKITKLLKDSIKSYDELIASYIELHNIINEENFTDFINNLQKSIETSLNEINNEFIKNLKEISKICHKNLESSKIDFIGQNKLLKVKKIDSKIQYKIDTKTLKNELFDENNNYSRQNRANIYKLTKLKEDTINKIKQKREDFIRDITIWQTKIQNLNQISTFITDIHIYNLKLYALKVYENIINSFVLLLLDLTLHTITQIAKVESTFEIQRKLILEFILSKLNDDLEKIESKPKISEIEKIIENIINSYIFTNKFDCNILKNISIAIESTKSIKCEQINKIILDIEALKENIQNVLGTINKGK